MLHLFFTDNAPNSPQKVSADYLSGTLFVCPYGLQCFKYLLKLKYFPTRKVLAPPANSTAIIFLKFFVIEERKKTVAL